MAETDAVERLGLWGGAAVREAGGLSAAGRGAVGVWLAQAAPRKAPLVPTPFGTETVTQFSATHVNLGYEPGQVR